MPNLCGHYLGAEQRHCSSAHGVRLYLPGPRCPIHTPNALKGLPEADAHRQKEADAMASWLQDPMVAFDLETTGVDVETDRIVTASVVAIDPGAYTIATNWLVNPGVDIPDAAAAIHGITTERAEAEGRHPEHALSEIVDTLATAIEAGKPIVTMNGSFDLTILDRECRRHGIPSLTAQFGRFGPVIDVRVLDKRVDPYRPGGRKLADLCKHYGVKHDGEHNANEDALAAARVLWRIATKHNVIGQLTLDQLHTEQIVWHREQVESFAAYRKRTGNPLTDASTDWPVRAYVGAAA